MEMFVKHTIPMIVLALFAMGVGVGAAAAPTYKCRIEAAYRNWWHPTKMVTGGGITLYF